MGKPNNIIDFEIARARRQADPKATSKAMKKALDRINKGTDKVPKKKKTVFFKECPLVTKALGCKTASAIFRRLEYRFYTMPKGFYKFLAPCKNRYYRKGDSLLEEMPDVSLNTIKRAFKKIITAYKSKSLYEAAKEELGEIGSFRGMPFLSYFDNHTHQTFYLRNKHVADSIAEGKKPSTYIAVFRPLKEKNELCRKAHHELRAKLTMSSADTPEAAFYKASQPLHRIHTNNTSSSISPSEPEPPSEVTTQEPIREEEIKKADLGEQPVLDTSTDMVKVWTETTGREKEKYQTKETVVNLERVFEAKFNSSIQEWEKYCRLITSSKWLMGEIVSQKTGKGFNINLAWASKEENIDKIMGGEYTMGDRSNAVNIPLREPTHADPQVLSFMRKALQSMGQERYTAYMQTARLDKNARGEIIMRLPYAYTAEHVAQNDLLGLGSFIGSVGVPAVLICKPDGGMVGRIEARNGTIMNLR